MTTIHNMSAMAPACSIRDDSGCVSLDRSDAYWATAGKFCEQGERIGVGLSLRGVAVWFGYDQSGVAA
jgi:hypothetical protein